MKKTFTLILISLLLLALGWLTYTKILEKNIPNSNIGTQQDETDTIENIKGKIRSINDKTDYQVKTLDNEWFLARNIVRDGGSQIDGYFKDNKIDKIVENTGLSFEVKTYEYYFSNEQLIAIHEINEVFPYDEETGSMDYTKLELVFEGYYYIVDGVIVSTETTGQRRTALNTSEKEFISSLMASIREKIEWLEAI